MGVVDEKILGKRLQEARQKAGLTQQQLCAKADLSISTLAKIERGAIKAPSIFTVNAIAEAVGITLDEMIGLVIDKKLHPAVNEKKRSKSGVTFVFFDVNGVLIRFFQRAFVRLAEDSGVSADMIESTFWHYNDAVCRGEMTVDDFNRHLAEQIGKPDIDWSKYYIESVDPIMESYHLAQWVSEHYKVGLLTNIMPGFLDRLMSEGKIPSINYDVIVDSSKVGAVKPDPHMFEIAQSMAAVPPSEILLIDDGRTNVVAAEHVGWRVMWFDDYHPEESCERVKQALEF